MRKKSNILKSASSHFKYSNNKTFDEFSSEELSKITKSSALAYSSYIHNVTTLLFTAIRTQISCFKHNISIQYTI